MKISLLHPSRQRPERSEAAMSKFINYAGTNDIELIVSLDDDEPFMSDYIKAYGKVLVNPNRSAVDAINNAAKACTGDIMIVVSDDTDCEPEWAIKILDAVHGKSDYILKVWDGIQPWIITMPVMDRVYYNRFGYVYYPEFRHMFCDTWLTHQAEALGRIIVRHDIVFNHLHYCVKKSQKDALNIRADATMRQGQEVYLDLVRKNFKRMNNYSLTSSHSRQHVAWLRRMIKN